MGHAFEESAITQNNVKGTKCGYLSRIDVLPMCFQLVIWPALMVTSDSVHGDS